MNKTHIEHAIGFEHKMLKSLSLQTCFCKSINDPELQSTHQPRALVGLLVDFDSHRQK